MDQKSDHIFRVTYNMFDVLSDIGGVYQVFLALFGILFYQISKQSYTLKLIEKLFFVKTCHEDTFKKIDFEKKNKNHKKIYGMEKYLHKEKW